MQVTEIKTICAGKKVRLIIAYDKIVLGVNNNLAIALAPMLRAKRGELALQEILSFYESFANTPQIEEFKDWLEDLGK